MPWRTAEYRCSSTDGDGSPESCSGLWGALGLGRYIRWYPLLPSDISHEVASKESAVRLPLRLEEESKNPWALAR